MKLWWRLIVTPQDEQTIGRSGFFNVDFYLDQIPGVLGKENPPRHYVTLGE